MTATVETVAEQLDLAAIMPAEKVVAAVARSVTLSDADVGKDHKRCGKTVIHWTDRVELNLFLFYSNGDRSGGEAATGQHKNGKRIQRKLQRRQCRRRH